MHRFTLCALIAAAAQAAIQCEDLAKHDWATEGLTLQSAQAVAATANVPAHCDVRGTFFPEARFAVKLPTNWNQRFQMVGGGGFAGVLSLPAMDNALRNGYATASTDTGHDAQKEPVGTFGYPGPANPHAARKVIHYAYLAVHDTAVLAKRIVTAHYGTAPKFSYWVGCSTGGRQGLIEAQRYPDDFDGYVIGAPVADFTNVNLRGIWNAQAIHAGPGAVNATQLEVAGRAVLAKCDALDGVTDGLLENPNRCVFDPLQDLPRCTTATNTNCFTEAQLQALKKVYEGPRDSAGKRLYGGMPVGAELNGGWNGAILGQPNIGLRYAESFMQHFGLQPAPGPTWSYQQFNWDRDPAQLKQTGALTDATNPDLSAVKRKGGRILHYHGWNDALVTVYGSIDYYQSVLQQDAAAKDFYRLFLVPGMAHCQGGPGCHQVDWLTPLVAWVENGKAPTTLIGTNPQAKRTRPLCAYPATAVYKGSGPTDAAGNFACAETPLPAAPPAPALQFAFEARVDLGPIQELGKLSAGERRIIPITGGTFAGPGLKGRILPGGADWQIVRADGTAELDARYTLETESGALIYVNNQGLRAGSPEVIARLRAGQPVDPKDYYFRAAPRFETSAPELQWLTRSIFICTAERRATQVVLQFWRVL